ncbi:cytochrome P450 [Basidiobolus meristosporus CBS 931.73]|uniref:Cytochrome P450 n=1 Tax=Basidiobolus meristosporus CBS 931.73 TaxID=1314790 RepID=A0A1Y1YZV1_9FUNG|nr:cytochrome P450 [Basidiobolus meristosporus CBS 931.73]|eukprot:ORY03085.1 cytochrome P450 [Basidiobolus meristosporus CBS 931.73]
MLLTALSLLALLYALKFVFVTIYSRKYLPPGPLGLPIVGNFLQLGRLPHLKLTAWARKYGPVFSIRLGSRTCVVVNDAQSVKEIFVKRGSNYSSRNQSYLINDVCFRPGKGVSVLPYGDQWKKMRKVLHRVLNSTAVKDYFPVINSQTRQLLVDLLSVSETNGDLGVFPESIMKKFSFNIVVALLIGRGLYSSEDHLMSEFIQITDDLHHMNSFGASFLAYFPFLNKLQINPIFQKGTENRVKREQIIRKLQGMAQQKTTDRSATLLETIQKGAEKDGLDEEDILYICDSLLRGGFDSAACTLNWATLIMAKIPEVQEKLHQEFDQVIGANRLPDYQTDYQSLPYFDAFLKELLRFRTPNFLGIPHASVKDDLYEQYFIPRDTLIILNSHAIHFDASRYASPEKFQPERFLSSKNVDDGDHFAFGAGRRVCAGSQLATREVWTAIAGIIWAFNITESQASKHTLQEDDMINGLANYPNEFRVKFTPRHEGLSSMIQKCEPELKTRS